MGFFFTQKLKLLDHNLTIILFYFFHFKLLEQLGIFPKIKRFAGTSAGAMTAALLAVGYNSNEIEESLSQDLSRIFLGMITLAEYVISYLIYLIHFLKSIHLNIYKANLFSCIKLSWISIIVDAKIKKNDQRLF